MVFCLILGALTLSLYSGKGENSLNELMRVLLQVNKLKREVAEANTQKERLIEQLEAAKSHQAELAVQCQDEKQRHNNLQTRVESLQKENQETIAAKKMELDEARKEIDELKARPQTGIVRDVCIGKPDNASQKPPYLLTIGIPMNNHFLARCSTAALHAMRSIETEIKMNKQMSRGDQIVGEVGQSTVSFVCDHGAGLGVLSIASVNRQAAHNLLERFRLSFDLEMRRNN